MRIENSNLKQLHSKSKFVTFVNNFTLGEENNMNKFSKSTIAEPFLPYS